MKRSLIALAAVPLALLSTPALAETPSRAKVWIAETSADIARDARLASGVAPVALEVSVGGNRRFNSVRLAGTSGSAAQDQAALKVARGYRIGVPPSELLGRKVTLRIAPGGALAQTTGVTTLR